MASIQQAMNTDVSGYDWNVEIPPPTGSPADPILLPTRNSQLRFASPYLPGTFPSSDNLTAWHLGGQMPQYRVPIPPVPNTLTSSTTTSGVVISSSSSSTTTNNPPKSQTVSLTTPTLAPNAIFTGTLTMAKSVMVLTVSTNIAARIRLYSTNAALNSDLSRPITRAPGLGTEQGIIADWNLDTAPVVWQATPAVEGANNDSPQVTNIYVAVTNISNASTAIAISLIYVPLQS